MIDEVIGLPVLRGSAFFSVPHPELSEYVARIDTLPFLLPLFYLRPFRHLEEHIKILSSVFLIALLTNT
jgi:hypothetical protein